MENNGKISGIAMVLLLQPDLEKAVSFYKDLGLQLLFHLPNRWAEFAVGQVKFGLCPTSDDLPDRYTGIVLQVENLRDFCQKNKESLSLLSDIVEKEHGVMVSFRDPGNNILDFYQPTPEKIEALVQKAKKEDSKKSRCAQTCC